MRKSVSQDDVGIVEAAVLFVELVVLVAIVLGGVVGVAVRVLGGLGARLALLVYLLLLFHACMVKNGLGRLFLVC